MAPKDPDAAPVEKSLCEAKGQPCILNFLCAPFVLCYQAHKIYACVCLWTYLDRSLTGICCFLCRCLTCLPPGFLLFCTASTPPDVLGSHHARAELFS